MAHFWDTLIPLISFYIQQISKKTQGDLADVSAETETLIALCCAAENPSHRATVRQTGGIDTLVTVILEASRTDSVQSVHFASLATRALAAVVAGNVHNQNMACLLGTVSITSECWSKNPLCFQETWFNTQNTCCADCHV